LIPNDIKKASSLVPLVDKILILKKGNSKADTAELENQIDLLVYELYDLTEDEIKVIEKSIK
jgi:adenine-specific DNA-methyltransferase